MKKSISLILALVMLISTFSFSTISYSATKPFAEDKLIQVQKKTGFIPNKKAKVVGNCYGFISAVCEQLHGVKYDGEGLYGNYRARHETGNYKTVKIYETKSTTPTTKINMAIRDFFIKNAQPGDVVHYGAYTTGSSNASTHTFMIQHIDREKMQIFHSNYETRTLSRESCHIDTIIWASFVKDSTKAIYNDDGSLYSHNNLFYNKMKKTGLGISINRLTDYSKKYQLVDNSLETQLPAPTVTAPTVPAQVKELEVTEVKATSIGIRWKAVDGAQKYYISIKNETKGTTFDKTVTEASTTLNNLTEGNSYTIKVRAVNKVGNGKYSSPITVTAKTLTPNVENFVVVSQTTTKINYTWDAVKNATKYDVRIKNLTNGNSYQKEVTENSTTIQGLTEGNVYSVKLRAYTKKGGWGSYTDDLVAPTKPAKVITYSLTSPEAGKLRLKWNTPEGNRTSYQIYISRDKAISKDVNKIVLTKPTTVSYSKAGFTKGKTYYAKIRAYVTVNGKKYYSSWSAVQQVKCK